jgi:hypothetical protein
MSGLVGYGAAGLMLNQADIHELGNAETLRLDERQDWIILQALLG